MATNQTAKERASFARADRLNLVGLKKSDDD
jgi:hypothetical protein